MAKILRRVASFGIVATLLIAAFLPIIRVSAEQKGSGEYELTVSIDAHPDWVASLTINDNAYLQGDSYLDPDGTYSMTMELHVPNEELRSHTSIRTGGGSGPFDVVQAGESEDWQGTHRKFTYTMSYTVQSQIDHLSLQPYSEEGGDNPNPEPQGNTEATVKLRALSPEGYYDYDVYGDNNEIVKTERHYYKDTYHEASFSINDANFQQMMEEDAVENEDYSQVTYHYNSENEDQTVKISVVTLWNWRLVNDYVNINNTNYPITINYDEQKSYLDHYGGQVVGFTIENVPKSDTYDIKLDAMQKPHQSRAWVGNFLWTSDPEQMYEKDCRYNEQEHQDICEIVYDENGDPVPGHDYIGHSELMLISTEYTVGNDTEGYNTYSCSIETMSCSWWKSNADGEILDGENVESCNISDDNCNVPYVEYDNKNDAGYEDGSLVVPSGARVTMQVIPNYGYQVMNVNMADLEVSENGIGRFTFTIPDGAAYFMADVVETEDLVSTDAEAIADGAIDLGDDQTTIDHGTAKLEVEDVDLNEEDLAGFEDASGDYNIGTYLNISLYNITCKGGTTCAGTDADSWSEQIDGLNEEATITLQLEEGVDGNEVVIVHQKHDGTYEVIPATYDAETHTITFKTSSFSNYAIASRTVASPETGAGTNFDTASIINNRIAICFVIMTALAGTTIILAKKSKRDQ